MLHTPNPSLYHIRHIRQEPSVHFRRSTAEEVRSCDHTVYGWITQVDEGTPFGRRQAAYIRYKSGRRFTEERRDDTITVFTFYPGQRCFHDHLVQNGTAPWFIKETKAGDLVYQAPDRFQYEMNEEVFQAEKQRKEG